MKKFVSVALAGALILSTGVFCPAPNFSTVAEENVEYTEGTYENLTYKKYADHIEISGCDRSATEVDIPETIDDLPVTEIGEKAFFFLNLKSVTIPDSITKIGKSAFCECRHLISVTIPDSVTKIEEGAFGWCTNLTSITIPSSVTIIEGGVFSNCESLTSVTIPDSITEIGPEAFCCCYSLTSVTIPDSVMKIEGGAFLCCTNLEYITIENPYCEIDDSGDTITNTFDNTAIIYGYPDSTAQAYAEKYDRKFVALDGQTTETLKGDANLDNSVTIADSVAILQYLANGDEYALNEKAEINADCCNVGDGVNTEDALQIQKLDAGVIDKL